MADRGPLIFRIGAVVNWLATIGGIIDPSSMATNFGIPPANYPFLVRIWSGMAFMFGCMFCPRRSPRRGRGRCRPGTAGTPA